MKFLYALAGLAGVDAAFRLRAVSNEGAAKKTGSLATMKTRSMARYMDSVRAEVQAAAEKKGMSYAEYDGDDDDMVYGEGGEEKELIDENPRIGIHQFIEDEEDQPDPETYEGEDTAQIDADDEETNFGADSSEGEAEEPEEA